MQEQLISFADFLEYLPIPESLESDARLPTAILNIQRGLLVDLLGNALYTDMLSNRTEQKYLDLLSGKDYTNSSGYTVRFFGIKPCLVWWAYAEFMRAARVQLTKSGPKVNAVSESENASEEQYLQELQNSNENAARYASECADFLASNSSTYPQYSTSAPLPQIGVRLASIKQPTFNNIIR